MDLSASGADEALPIHLATADEFHQLRDELRSAQFDEHSICERLEIDTVFRFRARIDGRASGADLDDALAVLIRLFLDVEPVPVTTASSQLSRRFTGLLERFRLVERRIVGNVETLVPRVWMYPIRDIIVASDLPADPGDPSLPLRQDAVYPAITPNTRHLLSALPTGPCASLLDLCAGTGVAALVAGAKADEVWATDIAARAIHFAEFNARVNGRHIHSVCGDVYEPLYEREFDRIVAHPPYIPTGAGEFVYRDGGEDGEQIVRRVISGLGQHLKPGGAFYGLILASDRRDAPLEARVRRFLGDRHEQFDIAVGVIRTYTVPEMLGEFAADPRRPGDEIEALRHRFQNLEVEQFVYGITVIRRRGEEGAPVTVRRQRGQASVSWPFEWVFEIERVRTSKAYWSELPAWRPKLSCHVAIQVDHGLEQGEWSPGRFRIVTSLPFESETPCPGWVPALLARCDGHATVSELFGGLKRDGLIPGDSEHMSFVNLIDRLIGWGVVEVSAAPLGTDSLPT